MKKYVATKVFFSYHGYNADGKLISYGSGEISTEELNGLPVRDYCLDIAKHNNKSITFIHLLATTPLEFKVIKA